MGNEDKRLGPIGRHPLIAFFILAYLISWLSFFILRGPFLFPFGSVVAAISVLIATEGLDGLKDFWRRCTRWRVSWIWYAAAIIVPIFLAVGAVYLCVAVGKLTPPSFSAPGYEAMLLLPMAMIDAPIWEDSGWRGFAMPQFSAQRSRFANTAILGLLLAGWHLPLALSGGVVATPYAVTTFLSAFVTNWIYYNSRQSALLAMIYHGSANAVGPLLFHGYPEQTLFWLYFALAGTNLIATVVILAATRRSWFERGETLQTE